MQIYCIIFGASGQVLGVIFIQKFRKDDTMWIEAKNGKFKAVERYKDISGKQRKISVTIDKNTAQSRKQAQATLSRKIELALEQQRIELEGKPKEVTLRVLIEEYRKDQIATVKKSTYKRNFHECNAFLKIFDENLLVDNLTASWIRRSFLKTGKSAGTLNEHLTRLKALLRWGYRNDLIKDVSYLDKIEYFKDIPHKEKIQDKFLESEEVSVLLKAMKIKKWKDLTHFLILSGLRSGEALALTISDIDLKERLIHVNKTYSHTTFEVTTPKTLCSIRDVYIQNELFPLCKMIKKEALTKYLATGCELFFQDDGDYLQYAAYNKYLRTYSQSAIGRKITPHVLRHTHASLLMEQGVDIDTISRRLGHENSKVTKEIYLHVTKKLKEKDNQRLSAVKIL
ncbi:MAG: tyrosine-type recombinase/integrase [Lachnospiraceae bacterium]